MPAGVSWSEYIKFFVSAMVSMAAGSQLVHMYYKPLKDLPDFVKKEKIVQGIINNGSKS